MQPLERAKQLVGVSHVETGPVVFHKIDALMIRPYLAADLNAGTGVAAGKLQRVTQEVDEDLRETIQEQAEGLPERGGVVRNENAKALVRARVFGGLAIHVK